MTLAAKFVLLNASVEWSDIRWAYREGIIGWSTAVEIADARLEASLWRDEAELELQLELLMISEVDSHRVGSLLEALAGSESVDGGASRAKWLYLNLLWLYENRVSDSEALEEVAGVWCDFGHPEEMNSFLYFLPAGSDRDPAKYDREENLRCMVGRWKAYLNAARAVLETSTK